MSSTSTTSTTSTHNDASTSTTSEPVRRNRPQGPNVNNDSNNNNSSSKRSNNATNNTPSTKTNGRRRRPHSNNKSKNISDVSSDSSYSSDSSSSHATHHINHKNNNGNNNNNKSPNKKRSRKQSPRKKAKVPTVAVAADVPEHIKELYVALDCEMVGVAGEGRYLGGEESALARVALVNWYGDVLLDTYVKVEQEVTDYRTFVSGIKPCHLESEDAMEFDEVRSLVQSMVADKVLVGHGLKSDFAALKLHQPWYMIRDSARYEPFMKQDPILGEGHFVARRLRELAKNKLGMDIQQDGKEHSPVEDAIAAMELYKKARAKWDKAVEWKINKTLSIQAQQQRAQQQQQLKLEQEEKNLISAAAATLTLPVCEPTQA